MSEWDIKQASRAMLGSDNQEWNKLCSSIGGSQETAYFAGWEMFLEKYRNETFSLKFMGYETTYFNTPEEAKAAAPEFARRVLTDMLEMIKD